MLQVALGHAHSWPTDDPEEGEVMFDPRRDEGSAATSILLGVLAVVVLAVVVALAFGLMGAGRGKSPSPTGTTGQSQPSGSSAPVAGDPTTWGSPPQTGSSEKVVVPKVTGMQLDEALKTLKDRAFTSRVFNQTMQGIPRGQVFDQYPKAGTELPKGSMVQIEVSGTIQNQ